MTKPDLRSYHADEAHDTEADVAYEKLPNRILPLWKRMVCRAYALAHVLGIHHWTRWMEYSPASDSFIDVGFICRNCPRGLYR